MKEKSEGGKMRENIVEFWQLKIHDKFRAEGDEWIKIPTDKNHLNAAPIGGGHLRRFEPEDKVEKISAE